jgi:hypothetical protein
MWNLRAVAVSLFCFVLLTDPANTLLLFLLLSEYFYSAYPRQCELLSALHSFTFTSYELDSLGVN